MKLNERIKEALLSKFKKKNGSINIMAASKSIGVSRQAIMYWLNSETVELAPKNLKKLESATGYKTEWIAYERGNKYWKKQVAHLDAEYELNVNTVTIKTNASTKLIEIINAADKAMNDSKCEFTVDERIDYYLEALSFAGRKDFSPDFIRQYVKELLKEK